MTGVCHSMAGIARPRTLHAIIRELGLTTNLNLVLDVADTASYDGSSQTWTDATGNGFNFFRGVDGTATASDPAFNGTAGVPAEGTYFSFDGGDFFKETAAHAFADDWHKDGGAFTILALYYCGNKAAESSIFGNRTAAGGFGGFNLSVTAANLVALTHSINNAASETLTGSNALTESAVNFVAVSATEASTNLDIIVNGTSEVEVFAASTSTEAPGSNLRIGSYGTDTPTLPPESGERLMCLAAWSAAISPTNLGKIRERLKARRSTTMP